jgi:hypothetical protein
MQLQKISLKKELKCNTVGMQFALIGTGYSKDIGFNSGALFLSGPLFFKLTSFYNIHRLLPESVPASCHHLG